MDKKSVVTTNYLPEAIFYLIKFLVKGVVVIGVLYKFECLKWYFVCSLITLVIEIVRKEEIKLIVFFILFGPVGLWEVLYDVIIYEPQRKKLEQ